MHTESGLRAIESVEPGERVWAVDQTTGAWKLCEVLERFERVSDGLMVTLTVGGEAIRCTAGHVVWVASGDGLDSRPVPDHALVRESMDGPAGRWVLARDVRAGDAMVLRTRAFPVPVERVSVDEASVAVYNLRVAECPTFAVGVGGLLVHNASNTTPAQRANLRNHAFADTLAAYQTRNSLASDKSYARLIRRLTRERADRAAGESYATRDALATDTKYQDLLRYLRRERAEAEATQTPSGILYGRYGQMSGGVNGQMHHINQAAAVKGLIPHDEGMSIRVFGEVFGENVNPKSYHFKIHQYLELKFWDQFREATPSGTIPQGSRANKLPTFHEYNMANYKAMRHADFTPQQAREILQLGIHEQLRYGLMPYDKMPSIPEPIWSVRKHPL